MQSRRGVKPDIPGTEPLDLDDVVLTRPENEQLFYTASVHFLQKRLEEKYQKSSNPQEASQSCCNLSRTIHTIHSNNNYRTIIEKVNENSSKTAVLSMQQVLPFPKSSKEGFFARLRNTFRKYNRPVADTGSQTEEDDSKHISNFKFPRCRRCKLDSSFLHKITEENVTESWKLPSYDDK